MSKAVRVFGVVVMMVGGLCFVLKMQVPGLNYDANGAMLLGLVLEKLGEKLG